MKKAFILTLIGILGLGLSNQSYAAYPYDIKNIWTTASESRDIEALKRYRDYVSSQANNCNYPKYNCQLEYNNSSQNYNPQIFNPPWYNFLPYYNNSSVYYNNQPYYQQPISSEFYKSVTNISNGVIINITSNNYSIVSMIQSSIHQSIVNEFFRQPVNISENNLYNGAQINIVANNLYSWYYNVWDNYLYTYRSIDSYSFIKSIQDFAANTMPIIRYDGYVIWWN